MGRESKREETHVYVWLIHFAVQLKLVILENNYTPIKINLKTGLHIIRKEADCIAAKFWEKTSLE